jgi:rhodanese-related sulfurtransferase
VECVHRVTGKKIFAPLGSTANRHGRVIGDNVTGGDSRFPGVVGTGILKALGLNVAATGLTEAAARASGYEVVTCLVPSFDHAHYYPGGKWFIGKLIVESGSGRLLGGQFVGPGDVAKRLDVIATAITFGATIEDVANLDLGYAPPFSTAIDSVAHASNVVRNKLEGLAVSVAARDLKASVEAGEPVVLLDVREQAETAAFGMGNGNVVAVPLSELRERLADIPRDKRVVCMCPMGLRAYEASVILRGAGFERASFADGGLRVWSSLGGAERG